MNKLLSLALLAALLSSCGVNTAITDVFIPPKNTEQLIARVHSTNNFPQFLNLKGRVDIVKKNQKTTLSITIKNRKDSIIWISASGPFGIEIIRAQLTPDSIYFVNRINKTYLIKPTSWTREFIKLDISFYDVQGIITANPKIVKQNYKLELTNAGFYLLSDNISYFITNNYRVQNTKGSDNYNALEFSFNDYQNPQNFPRKLTLKAETEEAFEITINYSKVEFNKPQNIAFKIPDSYNEIK
jgi:hypothetical protein